MPPAKRKIDHHTIIRTIAGLITIASAIVIFFVTDFVTITDYFRGRDFEPNEQMQQFIADLPLTPRANRILRATHPVLQGREDFNKSCASDNVEVSILGCYTNGNIFIFDINSEELAGIEQSTIAHELLHAVWARTSTASQNDLAEAIECVARSHDLYDRLGNYENVNWTNELHSIIGTEITDFGNCDAGALAEHYGNYFTDRTRVVAFFESYDSKFQALRQEAETLLAQINSLKEEIDASTANYQEASDLLNAAIADFNRRAENGQFGSLAEFNRERAELTQRTSDLAALFASINQKVDEANAKIEQYNANVTHTNALNQAINSNSTPPSVQLLD